MTPNNAIALLLLILLSRAAEQQVSSP